MDIIINKLLNFTATHLAAIAAAGLTTSAAALLAYFRRQIDAVIKWALAPITRRLPWNQKNPSNGLAPDHASDLTSLVSVVDVFLISVDGKNARYQKTSSYFVNSNNLNAYHEGVTAAGKASGFSTLWGTIVQTRIEHGFYISKIDLGDLLNKGSQFQNIYTAELYDCFLTNEEHWSQEIAFPTKHLTLRIHFPKNRPPKLVKCKVVDGVSENQIRTDAKITELSGENGILWDIQSPKLKDIYKLEWHW